MELGRYVALILLVGGLGFGVSYGLDWYRPPSTPSEKQNKEPADARHELTDFTLNENLADGEIWRINAPTASRSGDTVELESPDVVYKVDGDTQLTITASRGKYLLSTKTLTLYQNVKLHRLRQDQVLTTDRLQWNRSNRTVSTDRPVKLDMPRGTLTAVGMKTQLKEETIQFLSNVKYSAH